MNRPSPVDFDACIAELARSDPFMAFAWVPAGICAFWGEGLDWPDWLFEGTSYDIRTGLPRKVRLVDDLRVTANLIEHIGEARLIEMVFAWRRFPGDTVLLAAPDLASALRFLAANAGKSNPPISLRFDVSGEDARLAINVDPRLGPFAPLYEHALIALVLMVVRSFTGFNEEGGEELERLSVSASRSPARLARLIPCPVKRTRGEPFVSIPPDALSRANPGFNPELWAEIERRDRVRRARSSIEVEVIEAALTDSLRDHGRVLQFAEVACSLGRSERTLARNLGKAGVSYRALVDQVRMELAQLLLKGGLSVEEVGERLGYSEASAFVRSFRRQIGTSPARWRRNALPPRPEEDAAA